MQLTAEQLVAWEGIDLADPEAVIAHALSLYHPSITIASSWSAEDVAVIDMAARVRPDIRVFSLDTGRLNPETYECAERVREKYGIPIEWYFPDRDKVEALERAKGLFSFRETVDNRKECCGIRKVEPLRRALTGHRAWMTGLRRSQSVTRSSLDVVEVDAANGGILKISPLADWSQEQAMYYVKDRKLPYNRLYDQGYASIGCAPCTRAIRIGEDERAGRWWWESPEHKECGLHFNVPPEKGSYQI